jgi:hypothetical protein
MAAPGERIGNFTGQPQGVELIDRHLPKRVDFRLSGQSANTLYARQI